MKKISVIGLGNMGAQIASMLLDAGHELTVYNRSREKTAAFASRGARVATTPAEAARGAEAILSVVGDDSSSRAVWLGPDGALGAAPKDCLLVECSTLSIDWIRELAAAAKSRGLSFAEAGMGGGPGAFAAGKMNLFVGAEAEAFDAIKPLLAVFSARQFRFGGPGAGMAYKLVNNMMIDVQVSALCEGIAAAEAAGLDMDEVVKAISVGSISSPAVLSNVDPIRRADHSSVSFRLRWMRKDAAYMAELAGELGIDLPVAKAGRTLLESAADRGWLDQNWTVIAELYRKKL